MAVLDKAVDKIGNKAKSRREENFEEELRNFENLSVSDGDIDEIADMLVEDGELPESDDNNDA